MGKEGTELMPWEGTGTMGQEGTKPVRGVGRGSAGQEGTEPVPGGVPGPPGEGPCRCWGRTADGGSLPRLPAGRARPPVPVAVPAAAAEPGSASPATPPTPFPGEDEGLSTV